MKFTEEQKEAILTTEGNVCCLASAGSGKTSVFTNRIGYMIEKKRVSPFNIMAITFTNKASDEMKKRLAKIVGKDRAKKTAIGTTHSLFYRLLKVLDEDFAKKEIIPDWQKLQWLFDMCKPKDKKNHNGMNLGINGGDLASFISYQKACGVKYTDDLIFDERVSYVDGVPKRLLKEAYAKYEELKSNARYIDFDDMLLYMYEKLQDDSEFRRKLQQQYKYIMVDEAQDTSFIVFEIVKLINDRNVFICGDWRQSIYSFINARVDNILNFKDDFDNVKLIELDKNFRSTQNIVELSNKIIANSPIEKYKEYKPSVSVAEKGDKVHLTLYNNEKEQISKIADKIEEIHANGHQLSEIAILVRTNSMTAPIENIFAERDIPYDVSKTQSFFDRKEVLDILSYARLAVDESDNASFRRIYNSPNRFLSKKSLEELDQFASDRDISLMDATAITPQNADWKFKGNIDKLIKIIEELKGKTDINAGSFLRLIMRLTGYQQYIDQTATNAQQAMEKAEALDRLCEMASELPTIRAFLAKVISIQDKQKKAKNEDAVVVSTLHSSKGLEWDTVFVINCNEGLIPHANNNDVEEERRLMYVGCSRPRKNLYVSWYFYDSEMSIVKEGLFITELLGEHRIKEMAKVLFRGELEATFEYPFE